MPVGMSARASRRSRDSGRCRTRSRPCASVITTPWLRLFRAELMKALRRKLRRAVTCAARQHPQRDRAEKGRDDDAADQEFPDHVGIERADIARRRKAAGRRRTPSQSARRNGGDRHTTACAGIEFLLPACQFLPAITHPRISRRSVWLHGFGSGKRVPLQPQKCDLNYGNCPDMINASLTGAR